MVQKRLFLYLAVITSALGGFLFGYDTGVISGAIIFIQKDFSLTTLQTEIAVSAVLLGAVLGAAFAGFLSDRLGRRKLLLFTACLFTLASLQAALAESLSALVVGRFLIGVSIGSASMIAPLYIAEISPAKQRGSLVALNQFAITVGILISYLVDYAYAEKGQWRWMMGVAAIPSVIFGIGMYLLPESPRFLIKRKKIEEAFKYLVLLHGKAGAEKELIAIQEQAKFKEKSLTKAMNPWLKRALVVGIGLAIFQQVTGINTIIYYAPTIFEHAGFTQTSIAILATAGVGLTNVLATIIALYLLDRVGRRPLLLWGLLGMVISLFIVGFAFYTTSASQALGWMTMGGLILYIISFAIGLGPVFWVLVSEIYPLSVRGKAMSLATIANWGSNLLVALTFLSLLDFIGKSGTFFLYGLVGIGAWIFSYFFVPETKGKTLEEISNRKKL